MIDPALPRIDLHRHLDGNVRLETILDLGRRHNVALPGDSIETLRPHVEVPGRQVGLMPFLARLLEISGWRSVALAAVVEAVIAGVEDGRATTGTRVNLIGILSRTYGPEACAIELDALLTHKESIVALDLAGDEERFPAELFKRHFARARDAGWSVTVHAGEAASCASIWSAVHVLGADRIGHGTRAIDDATLMDYLAEQRIGVEANLTSNVQTGAAASYAAHPLKTFLDRGILASINTDNPIVSGIDWPHEIAVAAPAAGLDEADVERALRNALATAFLTPGERDALVRARAGAA